MRDRKVLTVTVSKVGKVRLAAVRVGDRDLKLVDGEAQIGVTQGATYWVYWYLEGTAGSSITLTIEDDDGDSKVELDDEVTEIPPRLGRNAGTKKFVA